MINVPTHVWEFDANGNDAVGTYHLSRTPVSYDASGKIDNALSSLSYVERTESYNLCNGAFSISIWFKPTNAYSGDLRTLAIIGDIEIITNVDSGSQSITVRRYSTGSNVKTTAATITLDDWHHIVITKEKQEINSVFNHAFNIYLNGSNIYSSVVDSYSDNTGIITIGDVNGTYASVDQVIVFEKAIGIDDVSHIYNSGNGRKLIDFVFSDLSITQEDRFKISWNDRLDRTGYNVYIDDEFVAFTATATYTFSTEPTKGAEITVKTVVDDIESLTDFATYIWKAFILYGSWEFNNNLLDSSGNNYNQSTYSGSASYSSGIIDNALVANSSLSRAANNTNLGRLRQRSYGLWFKPQDTNLDVIFRFVSSYGSLDVYVFYYSGNIWCQATGSAGFNRYLTQYSNTWHNLIFTYEDNRTKIYFDGVLFSDVVNYALRDIMNDSDATVKIINSIPGTSLIDQAFVSSPLTLQQTKFIYNNGVGRLTSTWDSDYGTLAPNSFTISAAIGPTLTIQAVTDNGSSITSYKIYRGTSSGNLSLLTTVSSSSLTSYFDNTGTIGATYYYKVSAVNAVGESSLSNEVSAVRADAPDAPVLTAVWIGQNITYTWTTPNSNGSAINLYYIEIDESIGDDSYDYASASTNTYTLDTQYVSGNEHTISVSARNSIGSTRSNILTIRPSILNDIDDIVTIVNTEISFVVTLTDDNFYLNPVFTLINAPSGASINSNGRFSWTPNDIGDFVITISVSSGSLTDTVSFTVTSNIDTSEIVIEKSFLATQSDFLNDVLSRRDSDRDNRDFNNIWFDERGGDKIVDCMSYEPDAYSHRCDYYYNTKSNRLFKKLKLNNTYCWKCVSDG